MSAVRYTRTRTDWLDGKSEILTVVQIDGYEDLVIEICAGPEIGAEFLGLYDLDGDQLNMGNCTWEAVDESEVPADVIAAIETDWESGSNRVVRVGVAVAREDGTKL